MRSPPAPGCGAGLGSVCAPEASRVADTGKIGPNGHAQFLPSGLPRVGLFGATDPRCAPGAAYLASNGGDSSPAGPTPAAGRRRRPVAAGPDRDRAPAVLRWGLPGPRRAECRRRAPAARGSAPARRPGGRRARGRQVPGRGPRGPVRPGAAAAPGRTAGAAGRLGGVGGPRLGPGDPARDGGRTHQLLRAQAVDPARRAVPPHPGGVRAGVVAQRGVQPARGRGGGRAAVRPGVRDQQPAHPQRGAARVPRPGLRPRPRGARPDRVEPGGGGGMDARPRRQDTGRPHGRRGRRGVGRADVTGRGRAGVRRTRRRRWARGARGGGLRVLGRVQHAGRREGVDRRPGRFELADPQLPRASRAGSAAPSWRSGATSRRGCSVRTSC